METVMKIVWIGGNIVLIVALVGVAFAMWRYRRSTRQFRQDERNFLNLLLATQEEDDE
jgi:hypothetical protein